MQYGQRKLQRSMTEMRRSRIGRAKVSRGAASVRSGTMTSRLDMAYNSMSTARAKGHWRRAQPDWWGHGPPLQPSRPAVQARHEALGVGIGPWRELHEPVRARERGKVPRAVGGG